MDETSLSQKAGAPKSESGNWLLWWKTDSKEVARQIKGYKSLPFFKTSRGVAVACILAIQAVTLLFVLLRAFSFDQLSLVDVGLFLFLAIFIGLGHRWAMVAMMVVWTIEKGIMAIDSPIFAFGQILWWCVFMHVFFTAFRVEQARRKIPATADIFE